MNKKALIIIPVLVAVVIGVAIAMRRGRHETRPSHNQSSARRFTPSQPSSPAQSAALNRVPAHFQIPPSNLAPTLEPEQFTGPTREAYRAVKEIPQTIAQLPCYCYCDEGFGHKSLYSCFEDDHGAHCAVCVNEVLMAYRMQKTGMTPAQIRERIVAHYSTADDGTAHLEESRPEDKKGKMTH